jgi:predicted nucleic acid-binding protein
MHRPHTVYVDTGTSFAAFIPSDRDHARAEQWLRQNDRPLVTTDYILDELLMLLLVRGER